MSENALATINFGQMKTRKTNLADIASASTGYLRRIGIQDNTTYVKQGMIKPGNIGVPVSKDEFTNLGDSVDLLLWAVREKVLDLNFKRPLSVYDKSSEEFNRIYWEVFDKEKYLANGGRLEDGYPADNTVKVPTIYSQEMRGFMYGPSFLVFERSTAEFYELYLSNGSGRQESSRMEVFLPVDGEMAEEHGMEPRGPLPCTLKGKYIDGAKNQWWAPVISKCSEKFDNLPTAQVIMSQIDKFINIEFEGGDEVEEDADEGSRAR